MFRVQLNSKFVLWRGRVPTLNEELIIRGFRGEREKRAALYDVLRAWGRF